MTWRKIPAKFAFSWKSQKNINIIWSETKEENVNESRQSYIIITGIGVQKNTLNMWNAPARKKE